jgi:hypothetical protein
MKANPIKKKGGARPGTGPKPMKVEERKVTVPFYIKRKHVAEAKRIIQEIVDKLNAQ